MNETMKTLTERRSCRSYKKEQITREELDTVLTAAIWAPTGMNRQHTRFVAVTDPDTVKTLSKMNAAVMGSDGDPFYGAPCVVIVFGDADVYTYVEDGSLAMGNMMNAAHSIGLGSCWIHRAKEMFESDEGKALMDSWGIPSSYKGVGNCILGYIDNPPADRPRNEGRIVIAE
ncbi:MAG: nitroreductase [Clostridia bacterium]|nr:nitroreductase [Clostridia bacterium]